jgi:signal transduction histidine kinase/CheY-like chemotaxis protein
MQPATPHDPALLLEEITALRAELARAREATRRADQRLSLALQAFESVVWELSLTDKRLFATGAVAAIYDEPPTYRQFSQDMLVACHPSDRARVSELWEAHLANGQPFRAEYRINRKDGVELWVEAATETVRGQDGQPERVIGVIKNVTGTKQDQLALAHAREAAETANRAKSDFLANMSHEIRTPLNGVMGVAGALGRTRLSPDQREMVGLIERSAHALERLLGDILDLARVEAGRFEVKEETFDLRALLHEVAALFEPRAREKGVAFFLDVAPELETWLTGDTVRLRQILSNLVSNAVKFTETGFVRLSVEASWAIDGQGLRFEVQDSGIGFDAATAQRLFRRFEQADGSITRRYGGTGLGLAISRSLAEAMGGTLSARSEPGQGACFTLSLELRRAPAPEQADAQAGCAPSRPARILLAEDHPTNRKVVELILEAAGHEIVHAENGAEAVAAAEDQAFHLILMDMQMPVMDGLTAIRHIRARERAEQLPRTPILTLTANAMAEHARASREAGADGHVTKPISAQALIDAVAEALAPVVQADGEAAVA